MEICPYCGRIMQFHMSYHYGTPFVYYTCECGYDTSRLKSYATSNTKFVPAEYYDYYIPSNKPANAIWLNGYDGLRCSNCWHKCETTAGPNHCPNCGASMNNYLYTDNYIY